MNLEGISILIAANNIDWFLFKLEYFYTMCSSINYIKSLYYNERC
jgi:hypothetical protein